MDIDEKTSLTNTFAGGMDTDTSDMLMKDSQYRLANNVRYITGTDENTGELHMIYGGKYLCKYNKPIVATTIIRDYGVIVWKQDKIWGVDRFSSKDATVFTTVFLSNADEDMICDHPSLVTRWEDSENVKVYIADGEHPIMCVNLKDENIPVIGVKNIEAYNNGMLLPAKFCGWTNGILHSGMVQYAYMLYHKHGKSTLMSPITKLIQISADYNQRGKKVHGEKLNKETNVGVKILIEIQDTKNINSYFNRILVYRIQYLQNGQNPTVELIADQKRSGNIIDIIDSGLTSLDTLTLEEFNSLSGIHIVPKVIESKNDYLFAANIKDKTYSKDFAKDYDARAYSAGIDGRVKLYRANNTDTPQYDFKFDDIPDIDAEDDCFNKTNNMLNDYSDDGILDVAGYYGGTGKNISWRFVVTDIDADTCSYDTADFYNSYGTRYNILKLDTANTFDKSIDCYYIKHGDNKNTLEKILYSTDKLGIVSNSNNALNWSNPVILYSFKSLKRDELYRYGIVFYDKDNNPSTVQWIADIRIPPMTVSGFETFIGHHKYKNGYVDLATRPIGIEFTIQVFPNNAVAYEIVRCNRTDSDVKTLSQGVIDRPMRKRKSAKDLVNSYPYTPTGFITSNKFIVTDNDSYIGYDSTGDPDKDKDSSLPIADNVDNNGLYEFISPEVDYIKDTLLTYIQDRNISLHPLKFLFGAGGNVHDNGNHFSLAPVIESDGLITNHIRAIKPAIGNANLLLGAYYAKGDSIRDVYPDSDYVTKIEDKDGSTMWVSEGGNNSIMPFLTAVKMDTRLLNVHIYQVNPLATNSTGSISGESNPTVSTDNTASYLKPMSVAYDGSLYSAAKNKFSGNDSYKVAQRAYAYIKLYELSNMTDVFQHGTPYTTYPIGSLPMPTEIKNQRYRIESTQLASEMNWDDCMDGETSNGKTTWSYKFTDKLDSVGSYNYNNWVSYCYPEPVTNQKVYKRDEYVGKGAVDDDCVSLLGPAGRSLLIDIDPGSDSANLISDCAGCVNRAIETNDGIDYEEATDMMACGNGVFRINEDTVINKVFAESALGTYLCNLLHSVTPYGGYGYQDRQLNSYYSYGDYHIITPYTNMVPVFDGDTYIQPLEHVTLHKFYNKDGDYAYMATFNIIYSIPVETSINLALTNGHEFSRNYDQDGITNILIEPADVNNLYHLEDPLYEYNTVYSLNPTSKLFEANSENANDEASNDLDYRVYYSDRKDNDERRDSWLVFKPANYLDVDTRYGAITELRTFHNNLLFWQEEASGLLSVDERVQISDDSNMPLILGTGGVLSRYDYFSSKNGMQPDLYVDAQSDTMLMWYDGNKHEICAYTGEGTSVSTLSKAKSIQNFVNKNFDTLKQDYLISYDKQFNEFIINALKGTGVEDGSLVYSEMAQAFTALYTIRPKFKFEFKDLLILCDSNGNIARWNDGDGKNAKGLGETKLLIPYLKYVINKNGSYVKVFDQAEMGGRFYYHDVKEHEGVKHLNLKFNTPLKLTSTLSGDKISEREYSFRYTIPREADKDWGHRMRGKTMQVELSSDSNSTDFSIQYVTTKFRISWS